MVAEFQWGLVVSRLIVAVAVLVRVCQPTTTRTPKTVLVCCLKEVLNNQGSRVALSYSDAHFSLFVGAFVCCDCFPTWMGVAANGNKNCENGDSLLLKGSLESSWF